MALSPDWMMSEVFLSRKELSRAPWLELASAGIVLLAPLGMPSIFSQQPEFFLYLRNPLIGTA